MCVVFIHLRLYVIQFRGQKKNILRNKIVRDYWDFFCAEFVASSYSYLVTSPKFGSWVWCLCILLLSSLVLLSLIILMNLGVHYCEHQLYRLNILQVCISFFLHVGLYKKGVFPALHQMVAVKLSHGLLMSQNLYRGITCTCSISELQHEVMFHCEDLACVDTAECFHWSPWDHEKSNIMAWELDEELGSSPWPQNLLDIY